MITAVEYYFPIPKGSKELLDEISDWLRYLPPSSHHTGLWSCHALCRAAHAMWAADLGWSICDGAFHHSYSHTWLSQTNYILDIYPVASMGGPILVNTTSACWRDLYECDDTLYQTMFGTWAEETHELLGVSL